jgi:predicted metal-dependent enzyme (double-stranded beta helix superfamily)
MKEADCTPGKEADCTPGCTPFDEFVSEVARGLETAQDDDQSTLAAERTLPKILADGGWLAPAYRTPNEDTYARNLIYRHPEMEFAVVAMVWQPGQGTPVHDHAGIWCVEGVMEGSIRITQYDPVGDMNSPGGVQLRESGLFESQIGDTGRLIPPFEYHKIENVGDRTAITIHVYGKDLVRCRIFEDMGGGNFKPQVKEMQYSPAAAQA